MGRRRSIICLIDDDDSVRNGFQLKLGHLGASVIRIEIGVSTNEEMDKSSTNPRTNSEKEEWYEKAQVDSNLFCALTFYWIGKLDNRCIRPGSKGFRHGGEGSGEVHAVV